MSLGKRLSALFSREQDPQEVLDASFDRQQELLQQTRRGAADVATARRRLELQLRQLQAQADTLHARATDAVKTGDDDTARAVLTRRAALIAQADELAPQERQLAQQQTQLEDGVARLAAKVEAFRSQKDALAAGLTAAQASEQVGQAMAGIDEELGDVGFAVQRARERTEAAQARAGALEELAAIGSPSTLSPGDAAERTLQQLSGAGVEDELAALKGAAPLPGPLGLPAEDAATEQGTLQEGQR